MKIKMYLGGLVVGIICAILFNIAFAQREIQPEDYGFIQDVKCGYEWYAFYVTAYEEPEALCGRMGL